MALPALPVLGGALGTVQGKIAAAAGGGWLTGKIGSSGDSGGIPNPLEDTSQMLNVILILVAIAMVGQLFDIQIGD